MITGAFVKGDFYHPTLLAPEPDFAALATMDEVRGLACLIQCWLYGVGFKVWGKDLLALADIGFRV